jgi:hypothetical protein
MPILPLLAIRILSVGKLLPLEVPKYKSVLPLPVCWLVIVDECPLLPINHILAAPPFPLTSPPLNTTSQIPVVLTYKSAVGITNAALSSMSLVVVTPMPTLPLL